MKKFLLSAFVIISSVIYSIYYKSTQAVGSPQVQIPTQTTTPTASPTSTPNISNTSTSTPTTPTGVSSKYKDGTYTGNPADAFYGMIQVEAIISGGKITNVSFLQAPNEQSTSIEINSQADPILSQEAIQTQSANVDIVTGATDSSQAFIESLQSALNQAQN